MKDWIPFHRRLAKGPKKGLPRAVRFVLLELSLESRDRKGIIDLPPTWDTVDAVHDLLGGNRREIAAALRAFTSESREEDNAISIEKGVGVHRIVVKKWEEWAGPKSTAERVAEHRERKRELTEERSLHRVTDVTPTVQDITGQDITRQDSTGETWTPPAAAAIEKALQSSEVFRALDCRAVAQMLAGRFATNEMSKGTKLPWVLRSIADCAADATGQGKQSAELTRMLRGYCDNARAPKTFDSPAEQARKIREADQQDGPIRMPKPPKEPDGPPASIDQMKAAAEAIAKIGRGAA